MARAAIRQKLLSNSIVIDHAEKQYSLRGSGNSSTLLGSLGEKIGSLFRNRDPELGTKIDLPEELPLVVKVFIFWLALKLWDLDSE